MIVVDAVTRLLPGALGYDMAPLEDSFATGLLEYPQYTRPAGFHGEEIPEILTSGDHARVARWRRRNRRCAGPGSDAPTYCGLRR